MRKQILFLAIVVCLAMSIFAPSAFAGYEVRYFEITMTSGTLETSITVPLAESRITDAYFFCPEMDAASTSTIAMTTLLFEDYSAAEGTITPNGWTDKDIGATADDAIIKLLSAVTSIYVDGKAVFTWTAYDVQAAPREGFLAIFREY